MWVPIALGRDVPKGTTRAVIVEGRELALWRGDSGSVQVWEDRCPHRGMRLSYGFVRGDSLNCLYHGWEYGTGASCRRIPAHPDLEVPQTIKAKAFPVAEAAGMIWTRDSGDEPMPGLPDAKPLVSLAIDAPPELVLMVSAAVPQGGAQIFADEIDGMTFHIGWHEVGTSKTMLHCTTRGTVEPTVALEAMRSLRARAERRAA
jgi:phenylpropionate dioxygenase-like ring-hydroxylating dioxygenase large terminal subunit